VRKYNIKAAIAAATIHGQSHRSRTYSTWQNMVQRCTNPNATQYPHYGGKGVTICPEWKTFLGFYQSMGTRPEGKTLGRFNDEGNYTPENCKWMTSKEQGDARSGKTRINLGCRVKVTLGSFHGNRKVIAIEMRNRLQWALMQCSCGASPKWIPAYLIGTNKSKACIKCKNKVYSKDTR